MTLHEQATCGHNTWGFNWDDAKAGDATRAPPASLLTKRQALRWGELLGCEICGRTYFLPDPISDFIYFVSDDQLAWIAEWSRRSLTPTTEMQARIDALAGDVVNASSAPCAAVMTSGKRLDPCVIRLDWDPLIYGVFYSDPQWCAKRYSQVVFLDDVAAIEPSRYALSSAIRTASKDAPFRGREFAPTVVRDRQGGRHAIIESTIFFSKKGVYGADLTLDPTYADDINALLPMPPGPKYALVVGHPPHRVKRPSPVRTW